MAKFLFVIAFLRMEKYILRIDKYFFIGNTIFYEVPLFIKA